jgi:GTP-binding protein
MAKPLVAIVGRPNVGKSTFFNRIIGARVAIVEDEPGVTRDRIYHDTIWNRRSFTLVDTGGIDPSDEDVMFVRMREQAQIAIDLAAVIVFVVDGRQGSTPDDMDVANMLRRSKKPVILVVNKMDNPYKHDEAFSFYDLGIGDPMAISATLGLGIGDVLDAITALLPKPSEDEDEDDGLKIAVVGKPNVGKSSLVNRLLGQNRVIVENIPGTTRDAIDTPFEREGERFVIIDTAGLRRKRSIEPDTVERYGAIRALDAVRRADVALIVVDASAGITEQDVKIAGYAHEQGRASIVVVNKWDMIEKDTHTMNAFRKDILSELAFMSYVPMVFISALTGQRVDRIFDLIRHVYGQSVLRIQTGMLNEVITTVTASVEPPTEHGRRLKILYATQVSVKPPTFVFFVNDPSLLHFSYRRYLENQLRQTFGFEGTPIRIIARRREE